MIWVSFNNWSLITPPQFVGLANFERAFDDEQFWVSLGYSLKYTLLITPILMVGGYLIALLTAANTPLRRFTRTVVFIPVVIGLGASSLLWYWLFSPDYGFVNRSLHGPRAHPRADPVAGRRCRTSRRGRSSSRSPGRSSASG